MRAGIRLRGEKSSRPRFTPKTLVTSELNRRLDALRSYKSVINVQSSFTLTILLVSSKYINVKLLLK